MSYSKRLVLIAAAAAPFSTLAQAQDQAAPAAASVASPTVAAVVSGSAEHTTLAKLFAAAGVDQTLAGAGPFTLFAPIDDAFTRVPPGTVETLLKPEAKTALTKLMNYLVVPGKLTLADIEAQAKASGGTATLTSVEGEPIKVSFVDGAIKLTDVSGNASYVTKGDFAASNGVVHAVNGVILPKQ